jgi:superfamily II DNA/RNA helicase
MVLYKNLTITLIMTTNFFNNTDQEHSLLMKFRGIAQKMHNFHTFNAVVGFFRSSGWYRLRQELENVAKIQILVGINVDTIFRKRNPSLLFHGDEQDVKEQYSEEVLTDIDESLYNKEVFDGVKQLWNDIESGKVELKIHPTKNLHAKFYLCLPEHHNEHSDGWVIMGSSNISASGLGTSRPPQYELNVAMKGYDDVAYCKAEFDKLWAEGIAITEADIADIKPRTPLRIATPYELYIRFLIENFGKIIEDDFNFHLPAGMLDLQYQRDAVIQGYQMLLQHGGFILADVVGLGKTVVAAMIAKRFIEANGNQTNVLVIYPPAVETNWKETFKQFGIINFVQFVSNGSIDKVLTETERSHERYKYPYEFDLIIVDEAHRFRNQSTEMYKQLQALCKSERRNNGYVEGRKKVMLLSATPLNNRPEDLKNLILLFQDAALSSVEGIGNLNRFFQQFIDKNRQLQRDRRQALQTSQYEITQKDEFYEELRAKLLSKITIRRTRNNILNDSTYRQDLAQNGIVFPKINKPKIFKYKMKEELNRLFNDTLTILTGQLQYARYRIINYLREDIREQYYGKVQNLGENLAGIFKVQMVKRLESSFFAFKKSLDNLLKMTGHTLAMFKNGKVLVADQQVMRRINAGQTIDEIYSFLEGKQDGKRYTFSPMDFENGGQELIELLEADKEVLQKLQSDWKKWKQDPKLKLFISKLRKTKKQKHPLLFNPKINLTGKLVIFSESVDTVRYLERSLKKRLERQDIIGITAKNRNTSKKILRECFDANVPKEEQSNDFNILIASDALSEGINLHRANVIVNYDAPWNATRIMQRNGRVNRIGSVASEIHNCLFYPSDEGDAQIGLYNNILIKLQMFHSLLGEDSQIFSHEEVVQVFDLFTPRIKDEVDKILLLQREIKELYQTDKELYRRIQKLPIRCRTFRELTATSNNLVAGTTLTFIKSQAKLEYYRVIGDQFEALDFITTAELLKAKPNEKTALFDDKTETQHYAAVQKALNEFRNETTILQDTESIQHRLLATDRRTNQAIAFLRNYKRTSEDDFLRNICDSLMQILERGVYQDLASSIQKIEKQYNKSSRPELDRQLEDLYNDRQTSRGSKIEKLKDNQARIVLSETFL